MVNIFTPLFRILEWGAVAGAQEAATCSDEDLEVEIRRLNADRVMALWILMWRKYDRQENMPEQIIAGLKSDVTMEKIVSKEMLLAIQMTAGFHFFAKKNMRMGKLLLTLLLLHLRLVTTVNASMCVHLLLESVEQKTHSLFRSMSRRISFDAILFLRSF